MAAIDSFYVKVIPPSGRARVHQSGCRHCRNGQGQKNQDKGSGPTRWDGPFPSYQQAKAFMDALGPRYKDVGPCQDCKPS